MTDSAPPIPQETWIIKFEDSEIDDDVFAGDGAEEGAKRAYEARSMNWNCHLFGPAERIARLEQEAAALREWKESVSGAIKCIPEFTTGKWGGDKEGWGFHFEVVQWIRRAKEGLEAQLARYRAPVSQDECEKYGEIANPNEEGSPYIFNAGDFDALIEARKGQK